MGYVLSVLIFCCTIWLASDFYFLCSLQTHKGGCNFWKWEEVYEEDLKKNGEIGQEQAEASSSMNQVSSIGKKMKEKKIDGGSITIERLLMEIVLLLKVVIFGLGVMLCLMLMLVCKQLLVEWF
jgi:hypothetical protein